MCGKKCPPPLFQVEK